MAAPSATGLATLSSALLARKGQARPAMRAQGYDGFHTPPSALDDLGWNDMGGGPEAVPTVAAHEDGGATPLPPVLTERAALAAGIASPPIVATTEAPAAATPVVVASVSPATAARLSRETAHAGKAAFTLRLDAARHLRLRLASAITNRSAQALVAHALDHFLSTLPEVETLVAQLPPATRRTK